MQSEKTDELFKAMSLAQKTMEGAKKGSENPFFKSKYADLQSVLEAVREHLSEHGLCVIQTMKVLESGSTVVTTTLGHESGQFISGECPVINTKGDAQGMGSAITYARRYSLAAICGVAQVDDDANAAVQKPPAPKRMTKKLVEETVTQVLTCIDSADDLGIKEIMSEFDADEKAYLWQNFDSAQRGILKEMMKHE